MRRRAGGGKGERDIQHFFMQSAHPSSLFPAYAAAATEEEEEVLNSTIGIRVTLPWLK